MPELEEQPAVSARKTSVGQVLQAIIVASRSEAPKTPPRKRKPQTLRWDLPSDVDYGWAMNEAPAVTVLEGNTAAVPVYTPALNARVPGFGDHTLTVAVAGNDEYEDATLSRPLHVRRQKLHVKAPELYKEVGQPLPDLTPVITGGLRAGDRLVATAFCEARADSPENLDGFPITVKLDWQQGLAVNYEVTVSNGWLKVRPGWNEMEKRIKQLRDRALKLPKDRLKTLGPRFDEVRDARLKGEQPDHDLEAETLRQLAIDLDEQEYFKVTDIVIAPHAGRIDARETLKLAASVLPKNASNPALSWTVDRPDLATVAADGTLTRTGQAGGDVVVTATSACRDGLIKSTRVAIRPLPLAVEVIGPLNAFLGETVQMTARVLPPEADQAVTWRRIGNWRKNTDMTREGALKVDAPSRAGGSAEGWCVLTAISSADPEVRSEETKVRFGGKRSTGIAIKPGRSTVELGQRLKLNAAVTPGEAAQQVLWSLDDDSIAHFENTTELSTEVVMDRGGTVKVRATSVDGSGLQDQAEVSVKVHLTDFDVTVAKTKIGIVETLALTPKFEPVEAACRIEWSVAEGGGLAPAEVRKNVLHPMGVGSVKLTASVPGTTFSKELVITVEAEPTMAVDAASWPRIKPFVEKFAGKVKVTENDNCQQKFRRWLYDLGEDLGKRAATRTLKQLKDEVIALRNREYRLSHYDWLAEAGFSDGSSSCMIRNDTKLDGCSVHITMFPTAETIAIGDDYDALENKIYRINAKGHVSVHATLYVNPALKSDECKVFASGVDWTPSWDVKQRMGGHDHYIATRNNLKAWLDGKIGEAQTALRALFDGVRVNDASNIL